MKRLFTMAIGFAVAAVASFVVPVYRDWPTYDRQEILRYRPFSGELAAQPKYVFLGSCDIAIPIVANDPHQPGEKARMDHAAWLGNMMNFVVSGRYGEAASARAGFYDISAPSTTMPQHLLQMFTALKVPNLRSIIYVGGLSVAHLPLPPEEALALVATLEYFALAYPSSTAYAAKYKAFIQRSDAFRRGVELYGPNWRERIDSETMVLRRPLSVLASDIKYPGARQELLRRAKEDLVKVIGGAAEVSRRLLDHLANFTDRMHAWRTQSMLDWAAHFYADEKRTPEFRVAADGQRYLAGEEIEINRAFMRLLAEIAKERRIKLVIYAQPMLYVTPDQYDRSFGPYYVDLLHKWMAGYEVFIIDHTLRHNLNQFDFQYEVQQCEGSSCRGLKRVSSGYWANAIGRYKQAELLLRSLEEENVVRFGEGQTRPAWRGAASLPDVDLCVRPAEGAERGQCLSWQSKDRTVQPGAGGG